MTTTQQQTRFHLFWCPGTCSRISFTAMEELGLPFEVTLVNRYGDPSTGANTTFFTNEGKPISGSEYLEVNPKGKVPALIAGDRVLTETPAIVSYLARTHPDAGLLPADDVDSEIEGLILMSWFSAEVHRYITPFRFPHTTCDQPDAYPSIQEVARGHLEKAFTLLEERLQDRDWVLGEWSVADAYMLWLWFRATGSGIDGAQFPRCADHAQRCEAWPSVASVLAREEQVYGRLREAGVIWAPDRPYQVGPSPSFTIGRAAG